MDSESMPATIRRRIKTCATAVDRKTTSISLLAARQLYGRDAAKTSARPNVCCAGSAATLNQSEGSMGQESFPFRNQHVGKGKDHLGVVTRRKRPRSNAQNGLGPEVEASSGGDSEIASKAAPRLTSLQLAEYRGLNGIGNSSVGGAGDSKTQFSENIVGCNNPHARVPVACAPETSNRVEFVSTTRATRATAKCGRRREARDRKRKQAASLKPVGPFHAAKRPVKQAPGALNGVSSLSQRELNRQMRLLTPGEQGEINRVLETFASQIDGKSMRTRDLFNLVSCTVCWERGWESNLCT